MAWELDGVCWRKTPGDRGQEHRRPGEPEARCRSRVMQSQPLAPLAMATEDPEQPLTATSRTPVIAALVAVSAMVVVHCRTPGAAGAQVKTVPDGCGRRNSGLIIHRSRGR